MKLWKKLMACTLAAVLALGVLTGCGQKVVMTEAFVDMVNRNLKEYGYGSDESDEDNRLSGLNLKLTEGSEYSKEANALLDKYVAAYQKWLKTEPILAREEPEIDKIAYEEMELSEEYFVCACASQGTKDLVAIQNELRWKADGLAEKICAVLDEHSNKTVKTITVAEKQVDGWYYMVAVTKLVNK